MNLQRLQALKPEAEIDVQGIMKFAGENYQYLKWNGRQIRNAFQTAYALAEYQVSLPTNQGSSTNAITELNADHFAEVAQITQNFEKYLVGIYGGDDSDRAKHDQLRHDHWRAPPGNPGPLPQPWGPQAPQDWAPGTGQDGRGQTGSVVWPYQSRGQNPPLMQVWRQGVAQMPGDDAPLGQWVANTPQMPAQYPPQNMPLGVVRQPNPSMAQWQNPSQNSMSMSGAVQQPPPQNLTGSVFRTKDACAPLQTPAPYQNPANGSSDEDDY